MATDHELNYLETLEKRIAQLRAERDEYDLRRREAMHITEIWRRIAGNFIKVFFKIQATSDIEKVHLIVQDTLDKNKELRVK